MKYLLVIATMCGCIAILSFSITRKNDSNNFVTETISYFRTNAASFSNSASFLKNQVNKLKKNDPASLVRAKEALKKCRHQYKKIEFFMSYFFRSASLVYNEANKFEVEEPFMEYREPSGLQVIESILFSGKAFDQKQMLQDQASLIATSAEDIPSLLYDLKISDKQILESIRLALIRVIALGISGFDAPELKSGITESGEVIGMIKQVLTPLLNEKNKEADSVTNYLDKAYNLLSSNSDFNSFDRLQFLTTAALPLQHYLGKLISSNNLEFNTTGVINYDAENLFSKDALDVQPALKTDPALVELGQKLFFEKGLSGNGTRNCATCHAPEKYFTDQIPKSITLDGKTTVQRNAPSLFYSAYQYSQFWDGRVKSLDEQINTVLLNNREMAADHKIVVTRLRSSKNYTRSFKSAFPETDSSINIHNIARSISAFLKSLAPFNSAFDRYIRGDKSAMTKQQVKGFNLYMGKAQCGTCHYVPVFNGLIPPLYKRTELEVLGTTKSTDFKHPEADDDSGRYSTFPIEFYKGAFKTPTLRDVAKTAPYMHNGAFSLEQVLEFYNKGGGAGLGLKVPTQTLSPKPLKLNGNEIKDIISFLNALTDTYSLPAVNNQ